MNAFKRGLRMVLGVVEKGPVMGIRPEEFEELIEYAHDQLGVANMTGEIQLADRYGYPISEDEERRICRIILSTPQVLSILEDHNGLV